jgi:hypothetical protein
MNEYNNSTVGGHPSSYANLSTLATCNNEERHPSASSSTSTSINIIPSYSPPGYGALTHNGAKANAGYFSISGAYGKN